MNISIREWMWLEPRIMNLDGVDCKYPRLLAYAETDYANANYHILVNDHDDWAWYTKAMSAIEQLAIDNNDWWYMGNSIIFTHENDKAMVYLAIR